MTSNALANFALETGAETLPPIRNASAVARFTGALDHTMGELADALRESRRARLDDTLSAALARLATELDPEQVQSRFVLDHLRGYVEAAARLSHLVGTT